MGRVLVPWLLTLAKGDAMLGTLIWNEVWLEFVLCAVLSWHATNGLARLARARERLIAVRRVPVPLRIYRSIGDEATAVLATSSLLTWIGTLAWRAASTLTIVVTGLFATVVLCFLAVPVGLLLIFERLFGGRRVRQRLTAAAHSRRAWAIVVATGTMLAFAVWGYLLAGTPVGSADRGYAAAVAMLVLAVLACSTLSGLGYGLTAPFLEISAESTPMGSWEVQLFAARALDGDDPVFRRAEGRAAKPASLSHSAAYGDAGVIGDIAAWIREREESRHSVGSHGSGLAEMDAHPARALH